jgi:hypothetical protein
MNELTMELRAATVAERTITGVVAPYDEVSYLTPHRKGERVKRGAFAKSIAERSTRIPLFLAHEHGIPVGLSTLWSDDATGLTASFRVAEGARGDEALEAASDGRLGGLSVGFVPVKQLRGRDGVMEVREGKLMEVSLTALPAYDSAAILSVRAARRDPIAEMLERIGPTPEIDLSPVALPGLAW